MTEVHKIVDGITPPIMNSLFQFHCNTHNIRNFQKIFTENKNNLHTKYKNTKYLDEFNSKIKT